MMHIAVKIEVEVMTQRIGQQEPLVAIMQKQKVFQCDVKFTLVVVILFFQVAGDTDKLRLSKHCIVLRSFLLQY
jgi:enoyl-[acyl-carrier-protein] reductase (NADH)